MGPGLLKIGAVHKPSRLQCLGGLFCMLILFTSFLLKRPRASVGWVDFSDHNTAFL